MDYDGYIVTTRPSEQTRVAGKRFWFRTAELFFRRWPLYLLPIVLLTGIGIMQAKKTGVSYESRGTLSVTSNPFVSSPSAGTSAFNWETPSATMARGINERLSTDAFIEQIAKDAGLQPALDAGQLTVADIRNGIYAVARGSTLLRVVTSWSDPQTAFELNQVTINSYVQYVLDTVAGDSNAAIAFYQDITESATAKVAVAQKNLDAYAATLAPVPLGIERDPAEQVQLDNLNSKLKSAQTELDNAEGEIQAAQLSVQTAQSEAGKVLKVIDPPELAGAPLSTSRNKIMTVALFMILGLVVAAAALIIAALVDNSVRSPADVLSAGLTVVATVRVVRKLGEWPAFIHPSSPSALKPARRRQPGLEPAGPH